jgi:hypothetical protein
MAADKIATYQSPVAIGIAVCFDTDPPRSNQLRLVTIISHT